MGIKDKIVSMFKKKEFNGTVSNLWQSLGVNWGTTKYLEAYSKSAYVFSVVKKRAEKVGQVQFTLTNKRSGEVIDSNEWLDLLYRPNKMQSKNEFFELYQTYKDLAGSVFILKLYEGTKVVELHLLRPDRVKILINKDTGFIGGYEYTVGAKKAFYGADDVIFSLYPNPLNVLEGQSPLQPGALSVDTERQLSKYQYSVLKNGGKVEGVFTFKSENLNESQIDKIKCEFAEKYSGADNSGKPLVLYGDTTYSNLGLTPSELSYIESKKMTRDDILMLYGVPKAIVAQTDGVNYANAKMAKEIFLSETIVPLLENLVVGLDEFLVPDEFDLGFIDPTPQDTDEKLKFIDSGVKNYYMTTNEARGMAGLSPIDGGDVINVPMNLMPAETDVLDTETKAVKKKEFGPVWLRDYEKRRRYFDEWIKKADRQEMKLERVIKKFFKDQRNRIVDPLKDQEVKHFRKKGLESELFDLELEVSIAKNEILPLLTAYTIKAGQQALFNVGVDGEYRPTSDVIASIDKRAELFARSINETTFAKLKDEFALSAENQETRAELVERIQSTYGDISKGRASTIARTETLVANQTGLMGGYESVGVTIKIWVSILDNVTRESHVMVDGEERPMNTPFSNGLMYPGDPGGDASEVINCRCTI